MELTEFVRSLSVGDVGFAGLLSLAIYLILTGRLVPKSTVDEIRQDRDAALLAAAANASEWKGAFETVEASRSVEASQFDTLIEYARTADHLIKSIKTGDRTEASH